MPCVSIILNVFNGAATLRDALQSVLEQTFTDWELIVWDDHSTDDSASIVASFDDFRIRYVLAPEQTSLGEARGLAVQEARCEWLAFLDQDDVWLPRKLEQQLASADSPNVGLIYGRTIAFSADGRQRDHDYFHEFTPLPESDIFHELLGRGCFIAMSSAMLRRSAVRETGGIPKEIHVAPDYFLYLAISHKYQVRAIQDLVCRYRLHPESMTQMYRRESLEESLLIIERWREQSEPAAYQRRRAHLSTSLAFEEIRHSQTFLRGLRRLARDGSVLWLTGRPFVHLWRRVRRAIERPYWTKSAGAS